MGKEFHCPALKRRLKLQEAPVITGPFRGLFLKLNPVINYEEFMEIFGKITFEHPGYLSSRNDRGRCIIYYKNSYSAATILDTYKDNTNFQISIYRDEISHPLHPEVLYIKTNETPENLQELGGKILKKTRNSLQIKFESFKSAAMAQKELNKTHEVKFGYKSEVPMYPNEIVDLRKILNNHERKAGHHQVTENQRLSPQLKATIKNHIAEIEQDDRKDSQSSSKGNSKKNIRNWNNLSRSCDTLNTSNSPKKFKKEM